MFGFQYKGMSGDSQQFFPNQSLANFKLEQKQKNSALD